MPIGSWGLAVRPVLPERLDSLYREGKQQVEAKKVSEGAAIWRNAGAEAKKSGDTTVAEWFLGRAARTLAEAHTWAEADAAYAEAIEETQHQGDSSAAAQLLSDWAQTFLMRNDSKRAEDWLRQALEKQQAYPESLASAQTLYRLGIVADSQKDLSKAEDFFRRALAIRQKWAPESLEVAASLNSLGNIAKDRGDLATADSLYRQALAIDTRIAPASRETAAALTNLGTVAWSRGDLAAAEDLEKRALVILEKLAPDSGNTAGALLNLGNIAFTRGDLAGAEKYFQRALAIQEKLGLSGLQYATILNNLGVVSLNRGDLATAEELYRRALAIRQKLAPDSVEVAASFNNLGLLASDRADLTTAEGYYHQALAIYEKQAPASSMVAVCLTNLGNLAHDRGDLPAAEEYGQRTLAIYEKLAPDSLDVARSLGNLGNVARDRGDLKAAEDYDRRALAIKEKLAPNSLTLAVSLNSLGELADKRNDFASAEQNFQRALTIREKLAPGSQFVAESQYSLGLTYRHSGKREMAADFLCRAVDSLEKQRTKIGGTAEQKSSFGAKFADYYRACIESLAELGRSEEAFHILERSRARSLLEMLAERDLLFASDLPEDIARERKLTDAEYERTQNAISRLNPEKESDEIDRQLNRLRDLRQQQEDIATRIRKTSPRFAALQYPQPLDLKAVRGELDPGTILLSYSVGVEKSFLFAVRAGGKTAGSSGLSVFALPVSEKELREKVETFRNLIDRHQDADLPTLLQQSRELYDLLIKPAEPLVASSKRILISPDGPLHLLPFGALCKRQTPGKKGDTQRYLIEWKPIHVIVSATLYAELKKSRGSGANWRVPLAAFGDPKYPSNSNEKADSTQHTEQSAMAVRRWGLEPLPSTRVEVESIASLYPGAALKYLGEEATEERAMSIGKDVRYLHFAVHGLLDERFPLNSALALTIPEKPGEGQGNGLLQAWKIFEQMRVDADLVTLSACETALGEEMGGEGLVGLARAFQYAGAHSIVASLWSVSDESTAELMKRFYGYLKAGETKDEALRRAQMDLIRSASASGSKPAAGNGKSSTAHPFHWAAFELIGDWK